MMKQDVVIRLQRFRKEWRRKVLWLESAILAALLVVFLLLTIWGGDWQGFTLTVSLLDLIMRNEYTLYGALTALLTVVGFLHFKIRRWAANKTESNLLVEVSDPDLHPNFQQAFRKNRCWWRSIFWPHPAGWGRGTADRLEKVLDDSNAYIQTLNDEYTNPSGDSKIVLSVGQQEPVEVRRPEFSQTGSTKAI